MTDSPLTARTSRRLLIGGTAVAAGLLRDYLLVGVLPAVDNGRCRG